MVSVAPAAGWDIRSTRIVPGFGNDPPEPQFWASCLVSSLSYSPGSPRIWSDHTVHMAPNGQEAEDMTRRERRRL